MKNGMTSRGASAAACAVLLAAAPAVAAEIMVDVNDFTASAGPSPTLGTDGDTAVTEIRVDGDPVVETPVSARVYGRVGSTAAVTVSVGSSTLVARMTGEFVDLGNGFGRAYFGSGTGFFTSQTFAGVDVSQFQSAVALEAVGFDFSSDGEFDDEVSFDFALDNDAEPADAPSSAFASNVAASSTSSASLNAFGAAESGVTINFADDGDSDLAGLLLEPLGIRVDVASLLGSVHIDVDAGTVGGGSFTLGDGAGNTLDLTLTGGTSTDLDGDEFTFSADLAGAFSGNTFGGQDVSSFAGGFTGVVDGFGLSDGLINGGSDSDTSLLFTLNAAAIPEPSAAALFGVGGLLVATRRRRAGCNSAVAG